MLVASTFNLVHPLIFWSYRGALSCTLRPCEQPFWFESEESLLFSEWLARGWFPTHELQIFQSKLDFKSSVHLELMSQDSGQVLPLIHIRL